MERLDGFKFDDVSGMRAAGVDTEAVVRTGMVALMEGAMIAGIFHGDLHGGNIFYEPDGRPGFLDWQLCFAGTYSHDMAWIIVTALDVEQRRGHERDLVETYRDALRAAGGPAPAPDDMWAAYRRQTAHAVASYGAVPRDNGPVPVLEEAGLRAFSAAIDHDVLGALGITRHR